MSRPKRCKQWVQWLCACVPLASDSSRHYCTTWKHGAERHWLGLGWQVDPGVAHWHWPCSNCMNPEGSPHYISRSYILDFEAIDGQHAGRAAVSRQPVQSKRFIIQYIWQIITKSSFMKHDGPLQNCKKKKKNCTDCKYGAWNIERCAKSKVKWRDPMSNSSIWWNGPQEKTFSKQSFASTTHTETAIVAVSCFTNNCHSQIVDKYKS